MLRCSMNTPEPIQWFPGNAAFLHIAGCRRALPAARHPYADRLSDDLCRSPRILHHLDGRDLLAGRVPPFFCPCRSAQSEAPRRACSRMEKRLGRSGVWLMSDPTVIRASDFLNRLTGTRSPMNDTDVHVDCTCGTTSQLASCPLRQNEDAEYRCPCCGGILVVIAPVSGRRLPGRVYRAGEFQLWNPARLSFRGTAIPAAPYALAR